MKVTNRHYENHSKPTVTIEMLPEEATKLIAALDQLNPHHNNPWAGVLAGLREAFEKAGIK